VPALFELAEAGDLEREEYCGERQVMPSSRAIGNVYPNN
jgi:hypothetical protein